VALSDEQNAMLRLLAQGEQGYADIAALMGLSEEDVRAKVVGALAQLQAEGKPAPDVPPPIAGGAHPAAEAAPPEPEPVEEPPAASEEPEPAIADAVAPSTAPEAASPAEPSKPAAAPKAAKPSAPRPAPASPADRPPAGGKTITLPTGRRAWMLGGGVLAAIAVIVVVILLVSGGGSDNSSTTAATEGPAPTAEEGKAESETETTSGAKPATEAKLEATDGSEAEGFASFGRVKNKLALQIEATNLTPTTAGTSYAIWLAQNPRKMIPLASTPVKSTGKAAGAIAAQFEVPLEILGYLASGTFDQIAITRVDNDKFQAAIEAATKAKKTPTYLGEEVLRGTIEGPIVGLAVREEEAKKAEEGE
jgi:outer membrane biosynthesis protein TonB